MTATAPLRTGRRRILGLVTATLVLGALLAVVPRPAFAVERGARVDTETPALETVPADARPSPESTPTHDHGDEGTDAAGEDADHAGEGSAGASSAADEPDRLTGQATDIDDFEMIGVGLATDHTDDAQIRIRIDGRWEPWQPLTNLEGDHGPEPGTAEAAQARPASDPIWVGEGDGYELDLPGDATDVEVHLVRETEERVVIDATEEAGAAYPMPSVLSRGAWGARSPSGSIGVASTVDRAVIHHTVNSNSYSTGAVPGMIRSIQAYHMDAQGWFDIGYNFVVDRFGRTWEGRSKSTFDAVIGAHAMGSNTRSTGVAWLGNGSGAGLTSSGHAAISRLIAWKLPLHGTFFSGSAIVGHRDVFPTSCPGNAIHSQLGSIRTSAVSLRPPAGPFLDVPNTAWNAGEILWGKYIGIATGYQDGNFLPGDALSRAQFVNMLWNLIGQPSATTEHGFTDVPRSSWLTPALDWAEQNGVMTGYPDSTFRGNDTMSRSTIAVVLWRWATEPLVATPHGFTDIAPGSWPDDALRWAKATGVVAGYPDGSYRGGIAVQRGQVLPMLYDVRPFSDAVGNAWFRDGAHWGFHRGIALGYPDRTFRPYDDVNRAQGTSMLWRMMDAPTTPAPPDHGWPDVPGTIWYDAALDWATDAGWVDGKPDGSFHGDDPMLRQTVVLWIWRTAGSPAATTAHGFSDVPGAAAYGDALDWAAEHDIVTGYPDGTFRPDDVVNRAQWMMMLYRLASTAAAWTGGAPPPSTILF